MQPKNNDEDYATTLLRYQPGKGWSPVDYNATPDLDAPTPSPTSLHKEAPEAAVVPNKVVSIAGADAAIPQSFPTNKTTANAAVSDNAASDGIPSLTKRAQEATFSELEAFLAEQSKNGHQFGLHALEEADLGTLGERLPEIFQAVDAYAKDASTLSWEDIAASIQTLQQSREERQQYIDLLADLDHKIESLTVTLKGNLRSIEKQERAKTAAARLKERLSLHTAQVLTKRLQTLLDQVD